MRHAILRTLVAVSVCAWSTGAQAAKIQKFESTYGSLELEGTVEVPLYDFPGYDLLPVVAVQVGEKRLFFGLNPSSDDVYVNSATVVGLGLDTGTKSKLTQKKADDFDVGTLDSLRIGDLTLENVSFTTLADPKDVIEKRPTFSSTGRQSVLSIDGVIGLGALSDVAWAIVPSEGVVRFTRAVQGQGDALVAATGTPLTPPEDRPNAKVSHFSKSHKVKADGVSEWSGTSLGAWVPVNGTLLWMSISSAPLDVVLTPDKLTDPNVLGTYRGVDAGMVSVSLGGTEHESFAYYDRYYSILEEVFSDNKTIRVVDGKLGRSLLSRYDIARNPRTGAMSFERYSKNARVDPVPLVLADAEAALKTAIETPPEAEEEIARDTTLPPGNADAWRAVAKAKEAAGDIPGALEAWKTTAEFEPNNCEGWLNYGLRVLEFTDRPADAREAMTKASALYHSWWDWAPETRTALSEILEKADEAGEDYYFQPDDIGFVEVNDVRERDVAMGAPAPKLPETGALVKAQNDSCDVADGLLARLALLEGDFETVESLYRDTFDLDQYVADIQGTAAIVNDQPQAAHEALRQAILGEWHSGPYGYRRAVLAQAYIAQGDRETADALLQRAMRVSSSYEVQRQWRLNSIELHGLEATAQRAEEEAARYTNSPAHQNQWLQLALETGGEAKTAAATGAAERALAELSLYYPHDWYTHTHQAYFELLQGNLDAARAAAERGCERAPQHGVTWAIAAEIAAAQGDSEAEATFLRRAAQTSPFVVEYIEKALADSE